MNAPGTQRSNTHLISLILATYNGFQQLDKCLAAIHLCDDPNLEIVIADDGSSKKETSEIIEKWKLQTKFPFLHARQEDKGFRLAQSRNNAVSISNGAILLFLDHDIILPPRFFKYFRNSMKTGWFAAGRRVDLDNELTQRVYSNELKQSELFTYRFAMTAYKRKLSGRRYLLPTRNRKPGTKPQPFGGMAGFCFGVFRDDFFAIDGFDSTYTGYGVEDWDFFARLNNNGVNGGFLPIAATVAHLWHKEAISDSDNPAYRKLDKIVEDKIVFPCKGFSNLEEEQ